MPLPDFFYWSLNGYCGGLRAFDENDPRLAETLVRALLHAFGSDTFHYVRAALQDMNRQNYGDCLRTSERLWGIYGEIEQQQELSYVSDYANFVALKVSFGGAACW